MNVEHLCFLSWFRGHESHEQDGERLRRTARVRSGAASGDPAMTFIAFCAPDAHRPGIAAASAAGFERRMQQAPAEYACFVRTPTAQRRIPSFSIRLL
jgi:hypothetical protein